MTLSEDAVEAADLPVADAPVALGGGAATESPSGSMERCALMTRSDPLPGREAPGLGSVPGLYVGLRVLATQRLHDHRPIGSDVSSTHRQDDVAFVATAARASTASPAATSRPLAK